MNAKERNECVIEDAAGIKIVRVFGEVDLSWSQKVRKVILEALGSKEPTVIDLSGVNYIDSSGIAALVEGFQTARSKNQKFHLVAVSAAVMAVLQLARLDRVFPIMDTIEQARAAS
jgi:anti-sigma B factor antagonist